MSTAFLFQERKEERTAHRIEQMLSRRDQLTASGALASPQLARDVDAAVEELERKRDLSRCIVHVDMVCCLILWACIVSFLRTDLSMTCCVDRHVALCMCVPPPPLPKATRVVRHTTTVTTSSITTPTTTTTHLTSKGHVLRCCGDA